MCVFSPLGSCHRKHDCTAEEVKTVLCKIETVFVLFFSLSLYVVVCVLTSLIKFLCVGV